MTKKNIHKVFFYTLLLAVYGMFFSVESFYNFEGNLNATAFFRHSVQVQTSSSNGQAFIKTFRASSSRPVSTHNLRLNKRFHLSEISLCPAFYVADPISYVIPAVLGNYHTAPLPTVRLIHRPLRGPPPADA